MKKDTKGKAVMLVAVVVDDLLGVASERVWIGFIAELQSRDITLDAASVGPAKEFNGMRIRRLGPHHITLNQEKYVEETVKAYSEKTGLVLPRKQYVTPLGQANDKG